MSTTRRDNLALKKQKGKVDCLKKTKRILSYTTNLLLSLGILPYAWSYKARALVYHNTVHWKLVMAFITVSQVAILGGVVASSAMQFNVTTKVFYLEAGNVFDFGTFICFTYTICFSYTILTKVRVQVDLFNKVVNFYENFQGNTITVY